MRYLIDLSASNTQPSDMWLLESLTSLTAHGIIFVIKIQNIHADFMPCFFIYWYVILDYNTSSVVTGMIFFTNIDTFSKLNIRHSPNSTVAKTKCLTSVVNILHTHSLSDCPEYL